MEENHQPFASLFLRHTQCTGYFLVLQGSFSNYFPDFSKTVSIFYLLT